MATATVERLEFWESERTRPKQMAVSEEARRAVAECYDQSFASCMQHPFRPAEEVREEQLRRIVELVDLAFDVPVYRDKYEAAGIARGEVRSWEDFERLPTITKAELIEAFPDRCLNPRVDRDDLFPTRSSGSSGQTLLIRVDLRAILVDTIQGLRQCALQSGLRYGPDDLLTHVYTVPWWFDSVGDEYRSAFISSLMPTPEVAALLAQLRPAILSCYPTNLRSLLDHVEDWLSPELTVAIVHSEQSSKAEREQWSAQLGVPVLDEYSSEEATRIALELPCGHYHVCEDTVHLDVLDPETSRPQEPGRPGLAVIHEPPQRGDAVHPLRAGRLRDPLPRARGLRRPVAPARERGRPRQRQLPRHRRPRRPGRQHPRHHLPLDVRRRRPHPGVRAAAGPRGRRPGAVRSGRRVPEDRIRDSVRHLEDLLGIALERQVEVEVEVVDGLPDGGGKRRPIRRELGA